MEFRIGVPPLGNAGHETGFYMTQQEFAHQVGISQNYVSDMERGKVEVGAEILLRIAENSTKAWNGYSPGRTGPKDRC